MPIKSSSGPIRLLLPLQRPQLLVEPRCNSVHGNAQLIRRVTIVDGEFGDPGRAGRFQFQNFGDNRGFDCGIGERD